VERLPKGATFALWRNLQAEMGVFVRVTGRDKQAKRNKPE
jgi:hypothetical protein